MSGMPKDWKKLYNLPNILSLYRILVFPVILYFMFTGKELVFALFIVINFATDIADGMMARLLNLRTEMGARLDSMGDNLTYAAAISGILIFKNEEISPHLFSFFTFIILAAGMTVFSLIKFNRFSSFHLYSFKTGGYIQGIFFITLFSHKFIEPFYYIMISWAILSCLEHILIQLIIPEMKSDIKGLFWVLKDPPQEE